MILEREASIRVERLGAALTHTGHGVLHDERRGGMPRWDVLDMWHDISMTAFIESSSSEVLGDAKDECLRLCPEAKCTFYDPMDGHSISTCHRLGIERVPKSIKLAFWWRLVAFFCHSGWEPFAHQIDRPSTGAYAAQYAYEKHIILRRVSE
jgi:hypothetical protein